MKLGLGAALVSVFILIVVLLFAPNLLLIVLALFLGIGLGYIMFKPKFAEEVAMAYMVLREPINKEAFKRDPIHYTGTSRCFLLNAQRNFIQKQKGERLKAITYEDHYTRPENIEVLHLGNSLTFEEGINYLVNEVSEYSDQVKLVHSDINQRACEILVKPPRPKGVAEFIGELLNQGDTESVASIIRSPARATGR